jgi:hypothetical protein
LSVAGAAWCLVGTALVPAAGAAVHPGAGSSPAASTASATASAALTAPACSLPLTYDPYQGFRVGVPAGWELSTMGGTIVVSKDATGSEAALLYPAALTSGLTPASFFSSYLRYDQQLLAKEGVTLSFKVQQSTTGLPQASIDLRSSRALLTGVARVVVLPVRTQFGAQEVVFSAWWAPPSRWAADSAKLIAVRSCFSPASADLFQVLRDQSFTYIMPTGWAVLDEGQDNLDLRGSNNNADVSYLFFGVPPQYDTPPLALAHILQVDGVTVTSVLSVTRLADQQISGGAVQGQQYEELLGRYQGRAVHGLVYILTDSGSVGTFGVMRSGFATTNLWNSVNGGLIEMMGAVQHSFVQDLQDIQRLNQQWQAESAQEANFDDIINGQQLVEDPSTGQVYEAPYSSYDSGGADGGGYYGSNGQLLNPVSN